MVSSHAEWTAEWAGVYRRTKMHNGAPYYSKSGDDSRVVWRQKAAHGGGFLWHVGHPADVAQGEAVIAADDGGAASPDLVSSGWRAVEGPEQLTPLLAEPQAPLSVTPLPLTGPGTWRRSSRLRFVAPPPASVYLSGCTHPPTEARQRTASCSRAATVMTRHAPAEAAWLAGWLGEYVLRRDLLVNGWPTFESRRCGATPCDRRLWFAPAQPAAAHEVGSGAEERVLGLVYSLLADDCDG